MRGMQKLPRLGQQDKQIDGDAFGGGLIRVHHVSDHPDLGLPDPALRALPFERGPSDWNRAFFGNCLLCGIEFGQIAAHVDRYENIREEQRKSYRRNDCPKREGLFLFPGRGIWLSDYSRTHAAIVKKERSIRHGLFDERWLERDVKTVFGGERADVDWCACRSAQSQSKAACRKNSSGCRNSLLIPKDVTDP